MHSRVTLDQVQSVMAKTELQKKKMRNDLLGRLHSLVPYIGTATDLVSLEFYMGSATALCGFGRDNNLLTEDEYHDWVSDTNRKWQDQKSRIQERNTSDKL